MKQMLFLAAALALSACATGSIDHALIRNDGIARLNEPTRVETLIVTPKSVVEDSRCPINARCVWAGRLVLATRIEGSGWNETANLTLGELYATHGIALALVSAEPGKMASSPPSPPANLFAFEPR